MAQGMFSEKNKPLRVPPTPKPPKKKKKVGKIILLIFLSLLLVLMVGAVGYLSYFGFTPDDRLFFNNVTVYSNFTTLCKFSTFASCSFTYIR